MAAAVVAVFALTIWLADGVRLDEIARFIGYELIWVIAPGLALHEVLVSGTSRFRRLIVGWALGHVLEVLAFALTAALGARILFTFYPLAVLLPAGALLIRRGRRGGSAALPDASWTRRRLSRGVRGPWASAVAGVCALVLLFAVVSYFVSTPLSGDVARVVYTPDSNFHLSLAAEALHHWPITNPNVSGQPLDYYWFVHVHYAAVSQVTGIGLPVVVLALDIVPLLVLLVCELSLFGAMLARRWSAGPLAALLALLVSEVDLTKPGLADAPFNGSLPSYLVQSPTFLFGAIFFVPMVMLLCERLVSTRQDWRWWLVIALLAIGCGGAKGTTLPVAVGGLAVYLALRWLSTRQLERPPLIGLGVLTPVMLFFLVALYGSSGGLHVAPPGAFAQTDPVVFTLAKVPDDFLLRVGFWSLAVPLSLLFALVAPLLGTIWLLRRRGPGLSREQVLALSMLATSLVPLLLFQDVERNAQFFYMYGLLAGVPVSAGGLCLFFERWRAQPERSCARTIGFAALWSAALSALVYEVGFTLLVHGPQVPLAYLALYLPVTLAVVGLFALAVRTPTHGLRQQRVMYAVLAVLISAGVNAPLDFVPSAMDSWVSGRPLHVTLGDALTPGKRQDLAWVREHTGTDDVLALSPPSNFVENTGAPLNFYAAAFAERRVLLEGWAFTPKYQAENGGTANPFPARLRLERAAIDRADPEAISSLNSRYGVTYLLVSKTDRHASPLLRRRARLVHAGRSLDVYAIGSTSGRPAQSQ